MESSPRNWKKRDVLIGLLKNARQYQINRECGFYHMPAALLSCAPEQVCAVALYRSKRFFGSQSAGILEYGTVSGFRKLTRGEISEIPAQRNGSELYYRFDLSEWHTLERPIAARGIAPGISMLTTRFLLEHCRYLPELYLNSEEHWNLYTLLRTSAMRTHGSGSELLPATEGNTAIISGPIIGVYTEDGNYLQFDLRNFFYEPYGFLVALSPYISVEN